jgi:hypothetical protein
VAKPGAHNGHRRGIVGINAVVRSQSHLPLTLRHHLGMWDCQQCRVVHILAGPDYDCFALDSFASEADLRERFYNEPAARQVILDDISTMVDVERSRRRVLCQGWRFA